MYTNEQIIEIVEKAAATACHPRAKAGIYAVVAALKDQDKDAIFAASQQVYEFSKKEILPNGDLHREWVSIVGADLFDNVDSQYSQRRLAVYVAKSGL